VPLFVKEELTIIWAPELVVPNESESPLLIVRFAGLATFALMVTIELTITVEPAGGTALAPQVEAVLQSALATDK
jgi:hypothetical protein